MILLTNITEATGKYEDDIFKKYFNKLVVELGQKYMNYIDRNIKEVSNNPTIGILFCKQENKYEIEYCLDERIAIR